MKDILEMEEEYTNIYVFYEINNNADNLTWYYEDMPDYMGWSALPGVLFVLSVLMGLLYRIMIGSKVQPGE